MRIWTESLRGGFSCLFCTSNSITSPSPLPCRDGWDRMGFLVLLWFFSSQVTWLSCNCVLVANLKCLKQRVYEMTHLIKGVTLCAATSWNTHVIIHKCFFSRIKLLGNWLIMERISFPVIFQKAEFFYFLIVTIWVQLKS